MRAAGLETKAGDDRRHDERAAVRQSSTVRVIGGTPVEVVVEDLSQTGLLYRAAESLAIGTAVQIGLAGSGAARATVVRRDGDLHGCLFERPLPLDQLAAAFSNGTVVLGSFGAGDLDLLPDPVTRKWPRPVRALVLLTAGAAPWLVLAAFR